MGPGWALHSAWMRRDRVVKMNAEPEFLDRIKKAAEAERRSVSDLLHVIVEDWLDKHNR